MKNNSNNLKDNLINNNLYDSEKLVLCELRNRGIKCLPKEHHHYFDIETEGGLKIEVKHRMRAADGYFNVRLLHLKKIDFLILVRGDLSNPVYYIVPKKHMKEHMSFPVNPKTRSKSERLYRGRWGYIKNCC